MVTDKLRFDVGTILQSIANSVVEEMVAGIEQNRRVTHYIDRAALKKEIGDDVKYIIHPGQTFEITIRKVNKSDVSALQLSELDNS